MSSNARLSNAVSSGGSAPRAFGEALERLDGILRRLESEPMPLDTALSVFEEGVALVRESEALLREAEQRVTFLAEEDGDDEGPGDGTQNDTVKD